MRYCQRCVMPDTRPGSQFDEHGICLACRNHEKRKLVDWDSRYRELELLCNQYRGNGAFDCAIAVSGGKDSHFLVHLFKNQLHMNPLLIRVGDPFTLSASGRKNIQNLNESFGCSLLEFHIDANVYRKLTRYTFKRYGNLAFIDPIIYTLPSWLVSKASVGLGVPLVVYGEDPYLEYGSSKVQISANEHVLSSWEELNRLLTEVNEKEYSAMGDVRCIFAGHYVPWSSYDNYQLAKQYGFRELDSEWVRTYTFENWCQFDMGFGWSINEFFKAIKLGYGRSSDIASRLIREDRMTRDEAIKLVEEHDFNLDPKALDDFLQFTGFTKREFFGIADRFYNRDLWEKKNGVWIRKFQIV